LTDRAPGGAGWSRLVAGAALVVGCVVLARYLGLGELLSREGLTRTREWLDGLGALGPVAFITTFVVAVVAFVPALPFTILAGALFGPLWGTVYCSIASVVGACLAFLIARYAARGLVQRWVARRPALARLDRAAEHYGFRLVMLTRLVPLFPFTIQNYVYGITGIPFVAYAFTSWICMLPITTALTMAGSSLGQGGEVRRVLSWFALVALLFLCLFLLSRRLRARSRMVDELLRPESSEGGSC
jgi:uncharacterized membrane protein YdjX (TVP38/TMEM64 family)